MTGAAFPIYPIRRWADLDLDKVTEMVSRKEISSGEDRLVQTYLKKGSLIPRHEHRGPQWVYVLQGAVSIRIAGEMRVVREGEVLHVPAATPHWGESLEDSFVLDVRRD